jgi:hypothetical protein
MWNSTGMIADCIGTDCRASTFIPQFRIPWISRF